MLVRVLPVLFNTFLAGNKKVIEISGLETLILSYGCTEFFAKHW